MPDTEVKQLSSDSAQTRGGVPMKGGCAIAFGSIFIVCGVLLLLVGLEVIPAENESDAPPWILLVMAPVFAGPGLWAALSGLKDLRKSAQKKLRLLQHPQQYWLADYNWDHSAVRDDSLRRIKSALAISLFLVVFLCPFNYFVFFREDAPWFAAAIVGLFDLIAVALVCHLFYLLAKLMKYGRSYLRFERFPFFLGETLEVKFVAPRGIGRFDKMTFALRCVQERIERRESGGERSSQVVRYQLYGDEYVFDRPGELPAGAAELPIRFNLPQGDMGTVLAERPPRYWELEVKAVTPGVDYGAIFLVPVYAKTNPQSDTDSH